MQLVVADCQAGYRTGYVPSPPAAGRAFVASTSVDGGRSTGRRLVLISTHTQTHTPLTRTFLYFFIVFMFNLLMVSRLNCVFQQPRDNFDESIQTKENGVV